MNFIYIMVIAASLICCSSANNTKTLINNNLVGKWKWVSTNGGIASQIHKTPLTIDKNIKLTLSKNYIFSITENTNIVLEGTYSLSQKKSIYDGEMKTFIHLSDNYENQNIVVTGIVTFISNAELHISDNKHDGLGSVFKKEN
ncbi:hypothetical protein [Lutibacter sp. B1]|uniref:hypothetical protein n=1 Tax=Lutibacter sp. B1 TaxID=2725996 RepID=UPI00145771AD|nr:hypothetical protein [Lutibacter sp. B1]NLP58313.1 hypothetical protein [Lutibacter sp. B1]